MATPRTGSVQALFEGMTVVPADPIAITNAMSAAEKEAALIHNITSLRVEMFRKLFDPRRDIYDECGYPKGSYVNPELYRDLYERDSVAARVIEIMPKECWQCQPTVYEDADTKTSTPFEEAWVKIGKDLTGEQSWYHDEEGSPMWEYLLRADVLSGVGQYGIILIGLDDGKPLNEPAETIKETNSLPKDQPTPQVPKPAEPKQTDDTGRQKVYNLTYNNKLEDGAEERKILYLRVFPETQAKVTQIEANKTSPRFGMPIMYSITFNDPSNYTAGAATGGGDEQNITAGYTTQTLNVHWTRVVHIVDNWHQPTGSEIAGAPRCRPVLNNILALQKIYGASGEGYYKSGIPTVTLETHPSLGGDVVVDKTTLRNEVENMQNSLQKYLVLIGMTAKTLPPQLIDPTNFVNTHLEAICIKGGYPVRIFKGSERGELASSQDDGTHNDRLRSRRSYHVTPRIIVPLINRLIILKVLPAPKQYSVWWPDLETQTPTDKATVAQAMTQAISTYISGMCDTLIAPIDFFVNLLGFRENEVEAWLERAKVEHEKKQQELIAKAEELGMDPQIPGMAKPEAQAPIKMKEGDKLVDPSSAKPGVTKPAKKTPNGGGKPVKNQIYTDDEDELNGGA